jgi:Tfp pilus assembly protein PilN
MLRGDQVAALNLSRRPLINRRPVQRAATALWAAAAVVLAIDALVVVRHLTSAHDGRDRLAEVEAEIRQEAESLQRLDRSLRAFDLEEQNRHVEFLNGKIAQRTFPWSRLFEQLGDTLPTGVRLQSLRPAVEEGDTEERPRSTRSAATAAPAERWVQLQIAGEAETSEAILELVDALFRHPAFSRPSLLNEAQARSVYRFNLVVRYLPDLELPGVEETEAPEATEISRLTRTGETQDTSAAPGGASAAPGGSSAATGGAP